MELLTFNRVPGNNTKKAEFKFQYGATNISEEAKALSFEIVFKFQYGATNIFSFCS